MPTFDPTKFTASTVKPLPVILLLDVSGSMSGEKIQSLSAAVQDMLNVFRDTENGETAIHVAIITFGAEVRLHQPLASASDIAWRELSATGYTPLGAALKMAKQMIEDKNVVPSRAYRPTVVLVSDGQPNDAWEQPLAEFIKGGRSSKCDRMAMAIGADADEGTLGKFIAGTENPLFYAGNAKQLRDFFRFVTMSVVMSATTRASSKDKNALAEPTTPGARPATIESRRDKVEKSSPSKRPGGVDSSDKPDGGYW